MGSDAHLHHAAADIHHAAQQKDAQNHGQREQHEARHRLRQQNDPGFELFERHGHQRTHHQHRNGDGESTTQVQFDELTQATGGRQRVFDAVEEEPAHFSSSFDTAQLCQVMINHRGWQRFRLPVLDDLLLQPLDPRCW